MLWTLSLWLLPVSAEHLVHLSTLESLVYAYPIETQVAEILPMVHPPSSPSAFWAPPKGCRRKQLEVFVLYNLSAFLFFSKILWFFFFKESCKWHLTGLRVDKMAHRVKALPPSLMTWPWYLPHGEGQLAPDSCSLMARVFGGIHVTVFYTRIN